jgi:hypothetical protein
MKTNAFTAALSLLVSGLSLLAGAPALAQQTDADRARGNSYDDAWETGPSGWVAHLRSVHASATGKTNGFVIHIGDSITYANPYSLMATSYRGTNATDMQTVTWSIAGGSFSGGAPDNKNGWQLARFDHPEGGRSYTASSGITAQQWLSGGSNGLAAGPMDRMPLDTLLANTSTAPYRAPNFNVAIVHDAQAAVIMLGTNDVGGGAAIADISGRLRTMAGKLEARGIMVVLSTIPPRRGNAPVAELNTAITMLARTLMLPLIDFHAEILRRRPGTTWDNTLISADGIHPSARALAPTGGCRRR